MYSRANGEDESARAVASSAESRAEPVAAGGHAPEREASTAGIDSAAGVDAAVRRLSPERRWRLTRLLITKLLVELLFVSALAVGFYYFAFNPYFRGWSELTAAHRVEGWVVNEAAPGERVEVQFYIDENFVASQRAARPRPDTVAAGRARDELNGFSFDIPALPVGEYDARVYAVHASGAGARRTLQLIGEPMHFRVGAGE